MSSNEGKIINCRAAVLWKKGSPLTIENITVDPPKYNEVRVKMVSAGLCTSDAHFIWGERTALDDILDFKDNPVVLGHEGAGIVESVGPEVTSVKPGDYVIPIWMPQCDNCQLCAHPKTNFCLSGNFVTNLYHQNNETRLKINGKAVLAQGGTSTFSEYAVIRDNSVVKINPLADLKNVCIIGCAVGTGYGSALNIAKVHPGAKCAVWGLGPIGLSTLLGCKEAGAIQIYGVDINSDKEKIAKQFGANKFINPKDLGEPIEDYFQREGGLDYTFDCVGNQAVLNSAYNSLSPWGALTVNGMSPKGNVVEANVVDLLNGRQVMGGYFGNQKPRKTIQRLVNQYISGSLPIDGLITERIPLEAINEGFDRIKSGNIIRTVIDFSM